MSQDLITLQILDVKEILSPKSGKLQKLFLKQGDGRVVTFMVVDSVFQKRVDLKEKTFGATLYELQNLSPETNPKYAILSGFIGEPKIL